MIPKINNGNIASQLSQLRTIKEETLRDPKKLITAIKQMHFRIELHFDFMFLSRGYECPNHDFAILFRDQKDAMPLEPEDVAVLLNNFTESTKLPISLSYRKVRKDGLIYTCVYIDFKEPEKGDNTP